MDQRELELVRFFIGQQGPVVQRVIAMEWDQAQRNRHGIFQMIIFPWSVIRDLLRERDLLLRASAMQQALAKQLDESAAYVRHPTKESRSKFLAGAKRVFSQSWNCSYAPSALWNIGQVLTLLEDRGQVKDDSQIYPV